MSYKGASSSVHKRLAEMRRKRRRATQEEMLKEAEVLADEIILSVLLEISTEYSEYPAAF